MGNSIYLGGGIKSAFCGGNVKEIYQGGNKLFPSGVEPVPGYEQVDYIERINYYNDALFFYDSSTKPMASTMVNGDLFEFSLHFGSQAASSTIYQTINEPKTGVEYSFLNGSSEWKIIPYSSNKTQSTSWVRWFPHWDGTPFDFVLTKIDARNFHLQCPNIGEYTFTIKYDSYIFSGGITQFYMSSQNGMRFYSIKVWNSSKTILKHEIVAGRKKDDGSPCYIDLVTKEIFVAKANKFRAVKA